MTSKNKWHKFYPNRKNGISSTLTGLSIWLVILEPIMS